MEKLTLGQVLDNMKLDEVAVLVDKHDVKYLYGELVNQSGLQYDTNDNNILKTLEGHEVIITKYFKDNEERKLRFVIMNKDLYYILNSKLKHYTNKNDEEKSDTDEFDFVLPNNGSKYVYRAKLIKNREGNEMIYRVRWDDNIDNYSDYSMEHMNNRLKSGTWIKL